MSPPDEIHNPSADNSPVETQPMDVATAVGQLRMLVCGLGAALLVVSLALSAFVYKQNRNLSGMSSARKNQLAQLRPKEQVMDYLVNELAKYSVGKPEMMAVFAKHGVEITPPPVAGQLGTAPLH